jgi:hypothetical protein
LHLIGCSCYMRKSSSIPARGGKKIISIQKRPERFWGLAVYGNSVDLSARVKWQECENDHSLPSSAGVENECRYIPTTISVFMAGEGTALPHSKWQKEARQQVLHSTCSTQLHLHQIAQQSLWLVTGENNFAKTHLSWLLVLLGTAVAQWLRYCATNRKVAGSIPDVVMEFFIDINPSDRTMALRSTQSLTEMSTRSISWG